MTKREQRQAEQVRREATQPWNVEMAAGGGFEQVRERTGREEHAHWARMDRWARNGGGGDFDYSMNA